MLCLMSCPSFIVPCWAPRVNNVPIRQIRTKVRQDRNPPKNQAVQIFGVLTDILKRMGWKRIEKRGAKGKKCWVKVEVGTVGSVAI
jgi:hypothetical protein